MKIHKKLIISLVVGVFGGVLAANTATAQTPPAPAPAGGTFEQRLALRKAERKVVIAPKDLKRLTSRCVLAQGKIRTIQQRTTPRLVNRDKVYQRMDGKLWVAIGQLKLAERDTFILEKNRAALAAKVAAFEATAANYRQMLDDLLVVNCQADIVGFKALLDTARIYHAQLHAQSADIRNYVVNDIKGTLGGHASEMQTKASTERE